MSIEQRIKQGHIDPGMTFNQKVWALCARVPRGRLTTYGAIARALGCSGARAVGNALNRNPYAPEVPCHRVVGADGRLTGFAGGLALKEAMLRAEGIEIRNGRAPLDVLHALDNDAANGGPAPETACDVPVMTAATTTT